MEVKIGVVHSAREITFESNQPADDIEAEVRSVVSGNSELLSLTDERGRRILVPAVRLGYVEIGEQLGRRVGFTQD